MLEVFEEFSVQAIADICEALEVHVVINNGKMTEVVANED